MRYFKQLGIAVLAMFSLGIVTASVAHGAEVKLGLLPEKHKFAFKSNGAVFMETLSGKKTECKIMEGKGEGVSDLLGKVEFFFKECVSIGISCTGLSDTSGNITVLAEYHLRHLLEKPEFVHLVILIVEAHFSCLGVLFVVSGCVASDDLLTDNNLNVVNLLLALYLVNFLIKGGTKGDPAVPTVDTENSLGMENCERLIKEGNGAAESSAQSGSGVVEKCENGGTICTFLFELSGTP